MNTITTVGIDLAKNVFQVHAIDAKGAVIVSKAVRRAGCRAPRLWAGVSYCGTANHVTEFAEFASLRAPGPPPEAGDRFPPS